MSALGDQTVVEARKYRGVVEQPLGSNSGPHINDWLAYVHLPPGNSYCAAFVCSMLHDARTALGLDPVGFHPSASVMHLWAINQAFALGPNDVVEAGDIVIVDHGRGEGHTGIVTDPGVYISANTSPDGKSREGTGVYEHAFDVNDVRIAGYLRPSK